MLKAKSREEILALRQAFVDGWAEANKASSFLDLNFLRNQAAIAYPFPKITRQRVMKVDDVEYRIGTGGHLEYRRWCETQQWELCLTAEVLNLIHDLIHNPTREVEDC